MTRAQTMVLALLIVHALLGGLCLVVARGGRVPALRYWGVGIIAYAGGLIVTMIPYPSRAVMLTVGNSLIAYAPVASIQGVLCNTHRRLSRRWVAAALAATVSVLAYNNFVGPTHAAVNFTASSPIAIIVFLFGAMVLFGPLPKEIEHPSRFLASLLLFAVALWVARYLFVWGKLGDSNDRDRADFVISMFALGQIVVAIAATLALFWTEVRKAQAKLERLAFSDALTELPNRRATVIRFEEEAARAERRGQSFGLLVLDVDHFKQVNDQHGHLVGDEVLKHIAQLLKSEKRVEEMLGRIGGEEFVCFLSESEAGEAAHAANRLRALIAATPFARGSARLQVTVSGGLALYPEDGRDWDGVFSVADTRLYQSKREGRDRVTA